MSPVLSLLCPHCLAVVNSTDSNCWRCKKPCDKARTGNHAVTDRHLEEGNAARQENITSEKTKVETYETELLDDWAMRVRASGEKCCTICRNRGHNNGECLGVK